MIHLASHTTSQVANISFRSGCFAEFWKWDQTDRICMIIMIYILAVNVGRPSGSNIFTGIAKSEQKECKIKVSLLFH